MKQICLQFALFVGHIAEWRKVNAIRTERGKMPAERSRVDGGDSMIATEKFDETVFKRFGRVERNYAEAKARGQKRTARPDVAKRAIAESWAE